MCLTRRFRQTESSIYVTDPQHVFPRVLFVERTGDWLSQTTTRSETALREEEAEERMQRSMDSTERLPFVAVKAFEKKH